MAWWVQFKFNSEFQLSSSSPNRAGVSTVGTMAANATLGAAVLNGTDGILSLPFDAARDINVGE